MAIQNAISIKDSCQEVICRHVERLSLIPTQTL